MKTKLMIIMAVLILAVMLFSCGSRDSEPGPHASALKVECLDITNGIPTCTEPTIAPDELNKVYISTFTHDPTVSAALPVTIHFNVHNTGGAALSIKVEVRYMPATGTSFSSTPVTIQPGEIFTFDMPMQSPVTNNGVLTVSLYRPVDAIEWHDELEMRARVNFIVL